MGFNKAKAEKALWFFRERLTHTRGRFAKKPFIPLPWQHRIIWDLFGTERRPGVRRYDQAYIEIPKKNGKTEFVAGLALCALVIDEEPGAECYCAATTRDQANVLHRIARQMVRNDPALSDYLEILDSTKIIRKKDDPESFFQAISADAGSHDGINPHFAVYDELHRIKRKDLLDVLRYGSDARTQPLFVGITTAGVRDESPVCWELHEQARQIIAGTLKDPNFYACIYGLDQAADWTDEGEPGEWDEEKADWRKPPTGWFKANPSLEGNPGGFLEVDRVRRLASTAQRSPAEENSFRRFRLNQWTSQFSRAIPMHHWDACGAELFDPHQLDGKPCFVGLDLSTTLDLTAACLLFEDDGLIKLIWRFWLPGDDIDLREPRDIGIWAKKGLIRTTPGKTIDYAFIRKELNELRELYQVRQIGIDPWNATHITQELAEQDGFEVIDIPQGFGHLSAATKEFMRLVFAHEIRHNRDPVATWNVDCFEVKQNADGHIRPTKPTLDRSRKRIDGVSAAINALYIWMKQQKAQPYMDSGVAWV